MYSNADTQSMLTTRRPKPFLIPAVFKNVIHGFIDNVSLNLWIPAQETTGMTM